MVYLVFGLAVLLAGGLLLRAFASTNPHSLALRLQAGAGVLLLLGAGYMLLRGSLAGAIMLGSFGLGLLPHSWRALFDNGTIGGPDLGRRVSRVVTDHLEMELDLDTGDMQGSVSAGFFRGRTLKSLRPVELAHLWQDCRFTDPQSAQLVEAYLDRLHPTWRDDLARAEAEAPKGPDGKMARKEALEILGLTEDASEADVRRAHRELMLRVHPDRGGSTYLAAKINEAKDVALGTTGPRP